MFVRVVFAFAMMLSSLVLVAGCGSDGDGSADKTATNDVTTAYVDGMESAGTQLEAAGTAMEESNDWPSYSAAVKQLQAAVKTFTKLTPPDDVAAEHEDMVESLQTAVDNAGKVSETSSEASDAKATKAATDALAEASDSADSILQQLS